MARQRWAGLLAMVVVVALGVVCEGIDMSWQQYSGRASLPRSKRWRDGMRDTLAKLNVDRLDASDRAKVIQMKEWLKEDDYVPPRWYETLSESLQSPSGIVLLLLMLGIAVGAAVRVSSPSGGRQLGSSGATHANRFSNGAHRAMVDDRILSSAAEAAQLRRRAPGSS